MSLLALCSPSPCFLRSKNKTKDGPLLLMHAHIHHWPHTNNHGISTSNLATETPALSLLATCRRTCSTGAQPSARPLPESVAGLPDDCCRMTSAPFRVSLRVGEFLEAPPSSSSALPPPLDPPRTTRIRLSQQPMFRSSLAQLEESLVCSECLDMTFRQWGLRVRIMGAHRGGGLGSHHTPRSHMQASEISVDAAAHTPCALVLQQQFDLQPDNRVVTYLLVHCLCPISD